MDEGVAELRARLGRPGAGTGRPTTSRSRPRRRCPLWFGGSSAAARRRAAAVGDGWVPLFLTPDEYGPALAALRRETAEAGRDPEAVEAGRRGLRLRRRRRRGARARARRGSRELYRLPPKAFQRHLVAGLARDLRRRACAATRTPGPATSS